MTVNAMIELVRKRMNGNNGQADSDEDYLDDIKDALLEVNADAGTDVTIDEETDPNEPVFTASVDVTDVLSKVIQYKTEIVILERRQDLDVELSVSADTPMGRMNTTHRPVQRGEEIDRKERRYQRLLHLYLYKVESGTIQSLDIANVVLVNRNVPFESTTA